jgi:NitT/TauT family transport system ATP-binding protein
MSQAGLMLREVEHAYGPRVVVTGISLQVQPGRTVALVGPSGCGKTTLLRLCAGLLPVQAGALCNHSRTR